MGFFERVAARVFTIVFAKVFDLVKAKVETSLDYEAMYKKHDAKKNEMAQELMQANTEEERDAILTKIYNSRPSFE